MESIKDAFDRLPYSIIWKYKNKFELIEYMSAIDQTRVICQKLSDDEIFKGETSKKKIKSIEEKKKEKIDDLKEEFTKFLNEKKLEESMKKELSDQFNLKINCIFEEKTKSLQLQLSTNNLSWPTAVTVVGGIVTLAFILSK